MPIGNFLYLRGSIPHRIKKEKKRESRLSA
jgi:hypothetical protein